MIPDLIVGTQPNPLRNWSILTLFLCEDFLDSEGFMGGLYKETYRVDSTSVSGPGEHEIAARKRTILRAFVRRFTDCGTKTSRYFIQLDVRRRGSRDRSFLIGSLMRKTNAKT